ncbi:Ubiquitin_carboxyl-terminal hydrolase family protein [Hexamita inflata]|uniref:Ubiquitin carboxyl-terminal hydrolase family protein n=1 Tax=Hexamita inflata TaxID=28002 RepID=A0AA86TR70_9EUKA|nr:Ubiquitin carboxyl-terminal hydrolase family protein [Hexamita inflata]
MQPFRGLNNNGATCYLNSTIQALYHTTPYRYGVLQSPIENSLVEQLLIEPPTEKMQQESKSIIGALKLLFTLMNKSIRPSLNTMTFCHSLGMSKRDMMIQEDANELLKKLIDHMDKISAQEPKSKTTSKELYQQIFEGQNIQMIVCTHCGNISENNVPFTDFMMPIRNDFFQCLMQLLAPELIDGYKCEKCQQIATALKLIRISHIPLVAVMSLQRFGYDMMADEYKKDSSPVNCPVALDFTFIQKANYLQFCTNDDYQPSEQKLHRLLEYIRVLMMPWAYFTVINGQIILNKGSITSKTVQSLIMNDQEYLDYVFESYPNGSVDCYTDAHVNNLYYQVPLIDLEIPKGLYILSSIVCHVGSINSGHYYTLHNKYQLDNQQFKLKLFEANDEAFYDIKKPTNTLQYIAGKADKLDEEEEGIKKMTGFGNTGYMYFYENVLSSMHMQQEPVASSKTVNESIEQDNTEQLEILMRFEACILSNITDGRARNCLFTYQNNQILLEKIDFDYRKSGEQLMQLFCQRLTDKGYTVPSLAKFSVQKIPARRTYAEAELQREYEIFNNFNADEPLQNNLTEFKQKTYIFVEFETEEPYDFHSQYLRVARIGFDQDIRTYDQNVVKINEQAIKVASQLFVGQQNVVNVAVIKTAIGMSLLGENVPELADFVSKILIYEKNVNQDYFLLNEKQSDVEHVVELIQGDSYYYEIIGSQLSKNFCPLIVGKPIETTAKELESKSAIQQYLSELQEGYQVDIFDHNATQVYSKRHRKQETVKKLVQISENYIGDSDLGFSLKIVQKVSHAGKTQFKPLLSLIQSKEDFSNFTLDKIFAKASQYKSSFDVMQQHYLILQFTYNQTEQKNAFQFILNHENDVYNNFQISQHQTIYEEQDQLKKLWDRFSLQGAARLQFKQFQHLDKAIVDLRFFYLDTEKAAQYNNERKLFQLFNSTIHMKNELKFTQKMFKQQFYVYVEMIGDKEHIYQEMYPLKAPYRFTTVKIVWGDEEAECIRIYLMQGMKLQHVRAFCEKICQKSVKLYGYYEGKEVTVPEEYDLYKGEAIEMFIAQ